MHIAFLISHEAFQWQYSSCSSRGHDAALMDPCQSDTGLAICLGRDVCDVQGHRLVLLAEEKGKASRAEDLLFEAIYEKGLNISDISTLERIGEELQLPNVEQLPLNVFIVALCQHTILQYAQTLQMPEAARASSLYHPCPVRPWVALYCHLALYREAVHSKGSCKRLGPHAGQELPPVE